MSAPAKILLTLPSGEVRKYGLQMESIRIGRAADNTIVIEDPSLSAHHCVLRQVGTGSIFNIEDLESTNGIEVNGEETTMTELRHEDEVKIGEIVFIFVQTGRPEPSPLPPYVKDDKPKDGGDAETSDELVDDEDAPADIQEEDEEDEEPAPRKQSKPSKSKPASPAPKPAAQQGRQEYVQVENSGGCGSALISLLILLLAPVAGICLHHYFSTGRFLILDLISGSGS